MNSKLMLFFALLRIKCVFWNQRWIHHIPNDVLQNVPSGIMIAAAACGSILLGVFEVLPPKLLWIHFKCTAYQMQWTHWAALRCAPLRTKVNLMETLFVDHEKSCWHFGQRKMLYFFQLDKYWNNNTIFFPLPIWRRKIQSKFLIQF